MKNRLNLKLKLIYNRNIYENLKTKLITKNKQILKTFFHQFFINFLIIINLMYYFIYNFNIKLISFKNKLQKIKL